MRKFRKKPVVIEALQYTGLNGQEICDWANQKWGYHDFDPEITALVNIAIPTLEGVMLAFPFDWVIKGIAGEFYPCKDEIFRATYEEVDVENSLEQRLKVAERWIDDREDYEQEQRDLNEGG